MITVEEKTTIVGVAEMRKVMKEVLEEIKKNRVVLTKRNKPVGVILDYQEFKKMEELVDTLEDYVLGSLAKERALRRD
ncbi:MAG: type II toxin-antitoxin system Phd/YefM family antitoxin, partial [Candidatus Aminicenantes bacterium]|nr:type II toxin-antitoxin system Phd/YefM family antitoxin [Candidatus Aminicenantes bacterium]